MRSDLWSCNRNNALSPFCCMSMSLGTLITTFPVAYPWLRDLMEHSGSPTGIAKKGKKVQEKHQCKSTKKSKGKKQNAEKKNENRSKKQKINTEKEKGGRTKSKNWKRRVGKKTKQYANLPKSLKNTDNLFFIFILMVHTTDHFSSEKHVVRWSVIRILMIMSVGKNCLYFSSTTNTSPSMPWDRNDLMAKNNKQTHDKTIAPNNKVCRSVCGPGSLQEVRRIAFLYFVSSRFFRLCRRMLGWFHSQPTLFGVDFHQLKETQMAKTINKRGKSGQKTEWIRNLRDKKGWKTRKKQVLWNWTFLKRKRSGN